MAAQWVGISTSFIQVTEGQDVTAGAKKLFSSLQASNYNIKLNKAAQVAYQGP